MKNSIIIGVSILTCLFRAGRGQEVLVREFPLGVGGDIAQSFFEPYVPQLQALADTLNKYPLSIAIITGGVDGSRFGKNHDSQNPGLAIGRALALRNFFVGRFAVDSSRILVQSNYVTDRGGSYRCAGIRVCRDLAELEDRIESLEKRPLAENRITREITRTITDNMGIQLGTGYTSSPFGGLPIVTASIVSRKFILIEGIFGHTLWNSAFRLENQELRTRLRLAGGQILIYPLRKIPVGVLGGWIRVEEISQRYNEYVQMSEGPVIGLRLTPFEYLSVTGVQNTAKLNSAGNIRSRLNNDQFLFYMTIHLTIGGGI